MTIIKETFLTEYFLDDAIMGEFYDRKSLFFRLGDLFGLSKAELSDLYEATEQESVKEIDSESNYKQFRRTVQYAGLTGLDAGYTQDEELLINIKGSALKMLAKIEDDPDKTTAMQVAKRLMRGAEKGSVIFMRTLGIAQCEGVMVNRDLTRGVENLAKAMRWGDVTATLAMFRYSDEDKRELMRIFTAIVKDTPYESMLTTVADKYGLTVTYESHADAELLRRAVAAERFRADTYERLCDRVAFSNVIGLKDKEKVLFSKELFAETADMPLHLPTGDIRVDETVFRKLPILREKEQDRVIRGLQGNDLRASDAYRPICLCSSSDHILEMYASAIGRALPSAHVERIEVADLKSYNVEPTKQNIFVRSIVEDQPNVYLLVFKGDIDDAAIELTKSVLKSERRRKFALNAPAVTLDLSQVLPICICDKENERKLRRFVDCIELDHIRSSEKTIAIKEVLLAKSKTYAVGDITMTDELMQKFCTLSMEDVDAIIDRIVRENRRKGQPLTLDMDIAKPYINDIVGIKNVYGFGRLNHENQ